MNTLPGDLRARVLEAARREPSPDRRSALANASLVVATAAALTLNIFLAFGGARIGTRSRPLVLRMTTGYAILALAATWGALGRGRSMLGRSGRSLAQIIVGIPLALLGWSLLLGDSMATAGSIPLDVADFRCVGLTLLTGIWPLLAMLFVHRPRHLAHPRATGAALGAAAGAWAQMLVYLNCLNQPATHFFAVRLLPVAVLIALGAGLSGAEDRA